MASRDLIDIPGYRIDSVIGHGGMGIVYAAEQIHPRRRVALKILAPELSQDTRFRDRFIREADLAAAIDHPNIVPIYDAGDKDGVLYIAMRYVPGVDLRGYLREHGLQSVEWTLSVIGQVASALDAAHENDLIHRDVKPANILLIDRPRERFPHVYLTDFGLTKRTSSDSSLTTSGQFVGTALYAAPEQIAGHAVDGRVDVYAVGCVMQECLTGSPPFPRHDDVAILYAHLKEPPPPVTLVRPDLPKELDRVLQTALAKDPRERFKSVGALMRAAREAVESGVEAGHPAPDATRPGRRGVLPAPAASPESPLHLQGGQRPRRPSGRGGWVAAVSIIAITAVVATVIGVIRARHRPEQSQQLRLPADSRVAFVEHQAAVYVLDATGSPIQVFPVAGSSVSVSSPAWSPNGDRIAFTVHTASNQSDIRIVRWESGKVSDFLVTPDDDRQPSWAPPTGGAIAFLRGSDDPAVGDQIFVASLKDRLPKLIPGTQHAGPPSWSPDGRQIVFAREVGAQGILVVNVDRSGLRALTPDTSKTYDGPSWSPDGSHIAFSSTLLSGTRQIYVMNADGTGIRKVTREGYGSATQPAWTPDGRFLVFIRHSGIHDQLALVDIASQEESLLFPSFDSSADPSVWPPHPARSPSPGSG